MSRAGEWWVLGLAVGALLIVVVSAGWKWLRRPDDEWILPEWKRPLEYLPGPAELTGAAARGYDRSPNRAGEITPDEWEQLDPDTAAATLIAEWHDDSRERTVTTDAMRVVADLELLAWDANRQHDMLVDCRAQWRTEMAGTLAWYRQELEHRRVA